jgi:hypothetical protein
VHRLDVQADSVTAPPFPSLIPPNRPAILDVLHNQRIVMNV